MRSLQVWEAWDERRRRPRRHRRRLRLPTPIIAASGTFGYGTEFAGLVDLAAVGAISVKGLSLAPYAGKKPPRLVESPAGMLNAIGLQNIGVDAFLRERLPALAAAGARVVANFWGQRRSSRRAPSGSMGSPESSRSSRMPRARTARSGAASSRPIRWRWAPSCARSARA